MSRLKLFSAADKRAMKKLRDETAPTVFKSSCPMCNAGHYNSRHCFDCGYDINAGKWIDVKLGSLYQQVNQDSLVAKFEDGTCIMYNQKKWPILLITHVLILPV